MISDNDTDWTENRKLVLQAMRRGEKAVELLFEKIDTVINNLCDLETKLTERIVALETKIWLMAAISALLGGTIGIVVGKMLL